MENKNKAEEIFKKHWILKTGKEIDDTIFHHMKYCIDAMEEYRQSEIDELTKEVERLRNERKWISVEASLPNYYDLCLLMNNESKDKEDNWVVSGYYNHQEEKFYNQFQDKYSDCEIFPTHWQPLPPINQ